MPKNEDILVTGGAGSIGSELVRQLIRENNVYILDNNETAFFNLHEELNYAEIRVRGKVGDVRDKGTLRRIIKEWGSPTLIYHAAALKHVTPSAWSPEDYISTNIDGTLNILRLAEDCNAKMVNISTDKVVNANSIMGATKRVAEIAVRNAEQVSVRFGNVLGSRGSVIEIWQRQIDLGLPLTVTDENMTRYMMTIPEACELVIKGGEIAWPGKIAIMDMGEKVNVLKLAQEILGKSKKDLGIKMIGIRPGETLTETLMTPEEAQGAKKIEEFWII